MFLTPHCQIIEHFVQFTLIEFEAHDLECLRLYILDVREVVQVHFLVREEFGDGLEDLVEEGDYFGSLT